MKYITYDMLLELNHAFQTKEPRQMSSAIELYKEAYDLDFNKGESLFAEALYKEIIERFPHSDEKEYALVHLERIAKLKGNPGDPTFKPLQSRGGGGGLAIVCFILTLLLLVGFGFGLYYSYLQKQRIDSLELVINGLHNETIGNTEEAIAMYEQSQKRYPHSVTAYRCLAELYLSNGKFEQAELVSKQWGLLRPFDHSLGSFKNRLADSTSRKATP
jgi:tetratricopeptide (TPR) repeat protein